MSSPASFPESLVTVAPETESVSLRLDANLYPLGAIYAASYVYLSRCFILVDAPDATHFVVTLAWKKPPSDAPALERIAGEFANECLSAAWRGKIAEESRAGIEAATARALAGAMGPPSLEDLETFDFGAAPLEDPLGIAMSWEDKYGKKKDASKSAGAADKKDGDAT